MNERKSIPDVLAIEIHKGKVVWEPYEEFPSKGRWAIEDWGGWEMVETWQREQEAQP